MRILYKKKKKISGLTVCFFGLGPIGSADGIDLGTQAWHTQAFIRRVGAKTTPLPSIPQSDARKFQDRGKTLHCK